MEKKMKDINLIRQSKKEAAYFISGIKGITPEQANSVVDSIYYGGVPHIIFIRPKIKLS